jgi:adenine/guanine phosphoribosyltransferase-like PRPP-binding protein
LPLEPHHFWQDILPPGTHEITESYTGFYPAQFADGRQIALPLRVLPGDGSRAVSSLIVNQASFAVEDALAQGMADLIAPYKVDAVIGVPTLGLPLANNVARRLGHARMVPLGTSRKFWYVDELSEPLSSITSPTHAKTIFIDPRMLPLVEGKRVCLIDDVISSGSSMVAVLRLLEKAGIEPVVIAAAMLQSNRWKDGLAKYQERVVAPLRSPLFEKTADERWKPIA